MSSDRNRNLSAFAAILVFFTFSFGACSSPKTAPEIEVPIILQDAEAIKSIHLELSYDPYMLKLVRVKRGELADSSIFAYGTEIQGGLKIGLTADGTIDGSGNIAIMTFQAAPIEEVPANILLSNVQIYAVDSSELLDVYLVDGSYSYADKSLIAPSITCLQKTQKNE